VLPTEAPVRLNGVLFDLYGTTVDIEVDEDSPRLWRGLAAALDTTHAPVEPSEVRRLFQTLLQEEAERGREGFLMEPVFRRLLTSLEAGGDVGPIGKLFRELSVKKMHLRPYVEPLFEQLHRSGVKLGIVSNTEALLTKFELDSFPILQSAEAILLSSDVGVRKPDPEIFQLAVNRIGAALGTTVFIGNDWAADVLGARRAGIRAIYLNGEVTDGGQTRTDIGGVYEVAPTLEAISSALRMCGWHESGW
jgi:putative hydrolase of the HAD superfamily